MTNNEKNLKHVKRKLFWLRLDGAIVSLCFTEILGGMFGRFFGVSAGFGDVRRTFTVEAEFVRRVHRFPAFRFSIRANSSSMR